MDLNQLRHQSNPSPNDLLQVLCRFNITWLAPEFLRSRHFIPRQHIHDKLWSEPYFRRAADT